MLIKESGALPLASLNHISFLCKSLEKSLDFYQNVLGFIPIRRPGSFDFKGAWLFNYGIGIHLLQSEHPEKTTKKTEINPKDNHISFQCPSLAMAEMKLKEMEVAYVQRRVEEGGIYVDQLFFHDPDGFMIEICNCDNLPVVPLVVTKDHLVACKGVSLAVEEEDQQQKKKTTQYPKPANIVEVRSSHQISSEAKQVDDAVPHISRPCRGTPHPPWLREHSLQDYSILFTQFLL